MTQMWNWPTKRKRVKCAVCGQTRVTGSHTAVTLVADCEQVVTGYPIGEVPHTFTVRKGETVCGRHWVLAPSHRDPKRVESIRTWNDRMNMVQRLPAGGAE